MNNNPEQIKAEIEATRAHLSRGVNALSEAVNPANVVRRQGDKVRSAVSGAKDTIMGTASQTQWASTDALESAGEAISSAPQRARQSARGNPLAVGLVALGTGWLVSSLLPATRVERQAAVAVKEKAEPLVQEISDIARETAQNLQEPVHEAIEEVKSSGIEAVQTVKEEATSTASDLTATAKEGAQNGQESRQSQ